MAKKKEKKELKEKADKMRQEYEEPIAMGKIAKKKFNEIVKYLKDNNKFDSIDVTLIEIFARAYEDYLIYYTITKKEGAVLTNPQKGTKYIHPANMIMQQSFNTMRNLAKELGIGNLSRAKLDMDIREEDEFLEFLKEFQDDDDE